LESYKQAVLENQEQLAAIAMGDERVPQPGPSDQVLIDQKNRASRQFLRALIDAGRTPAPIAIGGDIHYDGKYRPQDLAAAFVKDQPILHGPAGTARHFVEVTDVEHLDPIVHVLDVPEKLYHKRLRRTGDEINAIAGYHLVLADRTYTLSLGSSSPSTCKT